MFAPGLALLRVDDAKLLHWTHGIETSCFRLSNAEQRGDTKVIQSQCTVVEEPTKTSWLKDAKGC